MVGELSEAAKGLDSLGKDNTSPTCNLANGCTEVCHCKAGTESNEKSYKNQVASLHRVFSGHANVLPGTLARCPSPSIEAPFCRYASSGVNLLVISGPVLTR